VIGIGHLDFDTVRTDGSYTLSGVREANQIFFSTALRRKNNINHSNWLISPYSKLSLAHTRLNSFSESGGITALTFNKQTINDAKIHIGTDINALIAFDNSTIKPFAKIEYNASTSDTSAAMHYNSESTNYVSDLDKTNRNWKLEYGADFRTKDGWDSSVSYMREQSIGSGQTSKYSDSLRLDVGVGF
jgi:outer membrane autotransporter protein